MRGILQVVLLLVLLPAILTAVLLRWGGGGRVARGAQPGGEVRGLLEDELGAALADEPVVAFAVSPLGETTELGLDTESSSDGRWSLQLPALDGGYALRFGGKTTVAVEQAVSLIGREEGEQPRDLRLVLQRGTRLVVELPDGGRGRWLVEGEQAAGPFGMFAGAPWRKEGAIEGRELVVDGLPVTEARVLLRFDGGARVEWKLRLATGENRLRAQP